MKIQVYSEIGKLRKVLLHRPGLEVERIYPEIFERILFDDIMWTEQAQKDHDVFSQQLKDNGVEVYYIENLVAEIFDEHPNLRQEFLKKFVSQAGVGNKCIYQASYEFFDKIQDNLEFIRALIAGIKKSEINPKWKGTIDDHVKQHDDYPFYIDPIPNILFGRDPIASIFDGFNIHNMMRETRKREGIFYEYLVKYHPDFLEVNKKHLKINHPGNMEGGDVLVINEETIFIGISERTTPIAAEALAKKLFKSYANLKRIIGIEIPKTHATMHLDTVLTQMDVDKFSIDLNLVDIPYFIYEIKKDGDGIKVESKEDFIINILKEYVHPNPILIKVAGGDVVSGKAELWNDGANCLALEPGKIFVYDRNVHTNKAMEKAGITLIKVPSGELGRGRGGPRCMAMPLVRDKIEMKEK